MKGVAGFGGSLFLLLGAWCWSAAGCSSRAPGPSGAEGMHTAGDRVKSATRPQPKSAAAVRSARARTETHSARGSRPPAETTALTAEGAVQRVLAVIDDSVQLHPTTVVWFFDVSPSAMEWGQAMRADIRRFYAEAVPQWEAPRAKRLNSAVWTIGREALTLLTPTADAEAVVKACDKLRGDPSGREATFQAIEQALDVYLPLRVKQQRAVLFVVVTDEAGDDWSAVDHLVDEPRKYALPIYVIGVPAPFGRGAALDEAVELRDPPATTTEAAAESGDSWRPILQGPESRAPERIQLSFSDDESLDLLDSGFGPFGLERLCRASGGAFLAVRRLDRNTFSFGPRGTAWPTPGLDVPDPRVMRRYLPPPDNAAAYQAQLEQNRARMALHRAAQLPPADVLRDPQLTFVKRNEADLKNLLDRAQQAAAKVAPEVDRLYELLREGLADAERLTEVRWQAGFDLALGRVCAAKARIDGYNAMLAALKRGKSFANDDSTTWVLQRAATCDASSTLQKLIQRAHTLLERVVAQHANTPWATIAQHELAEPMGWQWTEQ